MEQTDLRQFGVPGVPVGRSISADGSVHGPGHGTGHDELQLGDGHHHQPPGHSLPPPPLRHTNYWNKQ